MDITFTLRDLLQLLLYILGIGVLGYFVAILNKIYKLTKKANELVESNSEQLDFTLKKLPEITENIDNITKKTDEIIFEVKDDLSGIIKNANDITTKISEVTDVIDDTTQKLGDTVETVMESIADTTVGITDTLRDASLYIEILKEIIETIRSIFKK
ncbi:MAG: methyl-accepting chemotaxis protein [Tissierellales bacterium]|nr:methyl-accepting chemotaxis protein [Tissierellales bacterium]